MAIYTNMKAQEAKKHGMFRSSRLKSTDVGRLWDLIVRDEDDKEIPVDNGVAVKVGKNTGIGLQTRYATIAGVADQIAVTGSPANIKDAFTKFQSAEYNFYHEAGVVAKAYEVRENEGEVFGVAAYQFTTVLTEGAVPAFGNTVVVDGNGGWVELAADADVSTYGFAGRVYGYEIGDFETIVLIEVVKNEQL